MKIKFITNFAGNWEAGDVVETESLPNGNTLVDNVACIDTALLMEHCEVVTESEDEEMSFYNDNDIQLNKIVNEIKECMEEALEIINNCENDQASEYNIYNLKRDIKRFLEDH